MYVVHSLNELRAQSGFEDVVIACGVFDGVHRGHQRIVSRLERLAEKYGAHPVVVTFEPHPRAVLYPEEPPQYLTTTKQKSRIFRELGVEGMVILPFSAQMADTLPEDFLTREILGQGVRVRGICVGENWRFGRGSQCGDVRLLRKVGGEYNVEVDAVSPFRWYGYAVSSTRIRKAIAENRLEHAARMLTRPHTVRGTVQGGIAQAGEVLKRPTANLADPLIMLPPAGVYAAGADLDPDNNSGRHSCCCSIVYIGDAPTFAEKKRSLGGQTKAIEVHVFDFDGDLYGQTIEIQLRRFLRPSLQFDSPQALKEQIDRDIVEAKRVF